MTNNERDQQLNVEISESKFPRKLHPRREYFKQYLLKHHRLSIVFNNQEFSYLKKMKDIYGTYIDFFRAKLFPPGYLTDKKFFPPDKP